MKIAIIALGTQGDVQPYIALGTGLLKAGHSVRLITHENFEQSVRAHKLEFYAMQGNVQEFMESQKIRELLEKGNFLAINTYAAKEAKRAALLWAKDGLEACRKVDLILAGVGGLNIAFAIAEKLDVPIVQAPVFPFTPTSEFPGVLFPQSIAKLGDIANRISHSLIQQAMWQGFRAADTLARKQVLELPAAPFFGPYNSKRLNQHPTIYGFSQHVIPKPKDWNNARVTGYWFLETAPDWKPPTQLEEFLKNGTLPVYIGFGSMGSRNPKQTSALILEALKQTKQRAIIQSGWGGLSDENLPENVHTVDSVPHSWLFPRVAAVVHHGGAGTTAAGLRAGVPSIVIPFFGDQAFWGNRVTALGVGPRAIGRKQLTIENLAQAIEIAVTDSRMRQKARGLGAKIQAEDGIGNAVEAINEIMKN